MLGQYVAKAGIVRVCEHQAGFLEDDLVLPSPLNPQLMPSVVVHQLCVVGQRLFHHFRLDLQGDKAARWVQLFARKPVGQLNVENPQRRLKLRHQALVHSLDGLAWKIDFKAGVAAWDYLRGPPRSRDETIPLPLGIHTLSFG